MGGLVEGGWEDGLTVGSCVLGVMGWDLYYSWVSRQIYQRNLPFLLKQIRATNPLLSNLSLISLKSNF